MAIGQHPECMVSLEKEMSFDGGEENGIRISIGSY
jgi:hypothetical protein